MSFTPEIHRKVAWALASFFPIFTFTAAFLRTIPVPSILTQEITSIDSLPDELKLQLLHNNTLTLDPDDIDNLPSHLFLQMVPHSFHIPPLLVLISLVSLLLNFFYPASRLYHDLKEQDIVKITAAYNIVGIADPVQIKFRRQYVAKNKPEPLPATNVFLANEFLFDDVLQDVEV